MCSFAEAPCQNGPSLRPRGRTASSASGPAAIPPPADHRPRPALILPGPGRWTGTQFSLPPDTRRLAARLRFCLYDALRPAGGGTYSVVFRARCCASGEAVALKRMRLQDAVEDGLPVAALREASLLRQLADSPHIIQ